MKEFWEVRYAEEGLAYGLEPNQFLAAQRQYLQPGMKVLVVGDGEGRNGVWLAQQGLDVTSVDYAQAGIIRAKALATQFNVPLQALCQDLTEWQWPQSEFDAVVSIYLHFPSAIRPRMHAAMLAALKPGGVLIMEAFNKEQLNYHSGGPPDADALFSAILLKQDFGGAEITLLEESVVELNEGKYHVGQGAVVRLILRRSSLRY
jgi:cyclopropane fatty-acyl-phospholipid synthase-like methyltransferase